MKLAENYGDRPVEEFPMLFQRILQMASATTIAGPRCARPGPRCSRR